MAKTRAPERATTTIERRYKASLGGVWALWTTKDGIESWWGPGGFQVRVRQLDLKPGGELLYTMTAVGSPQVEFMKKAGMPLSTDASLTFDEVVPQRRLAYTTVADFVPGVEPYDVFTAVEFFAESGHVRMVLTLEAMHDAQWTKNATMGWEEQLEKLAKIVGASS